MLANRVRLLAALMTLSLSGSANAMLPIMMVFMGPLMGMDGMMQNPDQRSEPVQYPVDGDQAPADAGNDRATHRAGEMTAHGQAENKSHEHDGITQ